MARIKKKKNKEMKTATTITIIALRKKIFQFNH